MKSNRKIFSETTKTMLKIFAIQLFFFALYRLFFIVRYQHEFVGIPIQTILKSFFYGMKTDIAVISYFLVPLYLLAHIPKFGIESKSILKKISFIYYMIANVFVTFLIFVNLEFFTEYNSHLNYTSIEYLDTVAPIMDMIWGEYPIIRYSIFIIILAIIQYVIFKFIFIKTRKINTNPISRVITFILGIGLLFLGIRGGANEGVMRWGNAYYCEYNIANQASLNPIYNLSKDIYYANQMKKRGISIENNYFEDDQDAYKHFQKFAFSKKDSLIDENYPLYRYSDFSDGENPKDYNVFVILLETFSAELTSCLGGKYDLTPNFDKLAKEGILFDRFYTNGQRSNRAISSTSCSYSGVAGKCIMLRPQGQQFIPSIPSILKKREYSTHFFYGGDVNFDNMKGFLRSKGVDHFIGDTDFDKSTFINKWGALDGDLFDRSIAELDKAAKPFFAMAFTLTNHEPFDLPDTDFPRIEVDGIDEKLLKNYNTFRYTDDELGKFIEKMKTKDYFDKTIFIILGDHSKSYHHDLTFDYRKSHVPMLIYAPAILDSVGYIDSKFTSQIDIAPTICDLMDIKTENSFMGRSVFDQDRKGWVVINRNRNFGFLEDDFYLHGKYGKGTKLYKFNDFSGKDVSKEYPGIKEKLLRDFYGVTQTANSLYLKKRIAPNGI